MEDKTALGIDPFLVTLEAFHLIGFELIKATLWHEPGGSFLVCKFLFSRFYLNKILISKHTFIRQQPFVNRAQLVDSKLCIIHPAYGFIFCVPAQGKSLNHLLQTKIAQSGIIKQRRTLGIKKGCGQRLNRECTANFLTINSELFRLG